MPDASCESAQALEKAQNGNGQLLEKVGMDLGLAPLPLGFGATPAWGSRRAGLDRRDHANSQRDTSQRALPICASNKAKMHNGESVHANSRRAPNS
jgi:hypothetical protein